MPTQTVKVYYAEKLFIVKPSIIIFILKNVKYFCGKMTLSTALGFEPRSFDCWSISLTTEEHRRPTSVLVDNFIYSD